MKVVLLGAAGLMGADVARYLERDGGLDLVLADVRKERVTELARELGADSAAVDVRDRAATTRLLSGSDIAVNATWYPFNLEVMEACLAAGCDYLDLGGLYHMTRRQLEMARRFEEARRLAILGGGKAPGITNLLAAGAREHFDRIEGVHLRSGRRPLKGGGGLRLPYSPQTLLDEFTLPPVILRDGRLQEIDPLGDREVVRHPDPIGPIEYVTTLHSELATLPGFLGEGLRFMDFKVALAADTVRALETLVSLGFASSSAVETPRGEVIPRDVAVAVLSRLPVLGGREIWIVEVEVHGLRGDRPQMITWRVMGSEKVNGTALAAATVVGMYRDGLVKGVGAHAPELIVPVAAFLKRLAQGGVTVTETRGEEVAA